MRRNRARLAMLDTLKEAHDDVVSLVFHPDTNELAGFWDRRGLFIGPQYSLDEAMRTTWVQRELGEPAKRMNDLVALALFLSPVWEEDNADDVASAKQAVNDFLASREFTT